jgi:hypothetical protein
MSIKMKDGSYKCLFCDYRNNNPLYVNDHRDQEHDFVLVPMTRDMLFRLMQFIFTKDESLITEQLYKLLQMYLNNFNKREKIIKK